MDRPNEYNWAAIGLLIAGVFNIWIGAILFLSLIFMCCGVLWVVPIAVGILEVITAGRMLAGRRVHSVVPVAGLGLAASMMNFNVVGIAGEVIALALCASPPVGRWLEADPQGADEEW
jgi:hypothetical protein